MCDRHGKKVNYYCLTDDKYCCHQCKIEQHEVYPCECLHVKDVYDRLFMEMDEKLQDLDKLKERGKSILDGSYQRNLIFRVNDEETHLDRFYKDMKKKLKETKGKITAFTADELSAESRHQIIKFISKHTPPKPSKNEKAREIVQQMKTVKKLVNKATSLFNSLPNYVEVTVDPNFVKLLSFNSDPVIVRGRPKFGVPEPISSDEEYNDDGYSDYENPSSDYNDVEGMPIGSSKVITSRRLHGHEKQNKMVKRNKLMPSEATEPTNTNIIRWENNIPTFNITNTAPKTPELVKTRPVNKYEEKIAAVKKRLLGPQQRSATPEPVRNVLQKVPLPATARSDDILTSRPSKKLLLKNSKVAKYIVRERFQLDGCEAALVLKDSIILSLGESIQKRDRKTMKLVVGMKLARCSNMCAISGSSSQIAVLQLEKCITIIETNTGLFIVYRIRIHQPYIDLTFVTVSDTGPHHPAYVFAAVYRGFHGRPVNCVDLVQAKETRKPGRPPTFEAYAQEVNLSNQGYEVKEVFGIGAFTDGKIIIGTQDALLCVNMTGKQVWKTPVSREVSGVLCTKNTVFACIQDQKRIVTFNKTGFITHENIMPDLDIIPCKLSANWDILLIKDFKTKAWTSYVFQHGLFIV